MMQPVNRPWGLERFPEPWTVHRTDEGVFIRDAQGRYLLGIQHRQDLHDAGWTLGSNYFSAEEAEILAGWIVRLPDLLRRPQY